MHVGIIGFERFVGATFLDVFSQSKEYDEVGIGHKNYAPLFDSKFSILINANGNSSKRLADSKRDWEMNVDETRRFLRHFSCEHCVHLYVVKVYNEVEFSGD